MPNTKALKKVYEARKNGQSIQISTKDFSTVESLLPPSLDPQIIGRCFEQRSLERLPAIMINSPSHEFVQHNYAADTIAGSTFTTVPDLVTAEGASNAEWVPGAESLTVTVAKLALNYALSTETLNDAANWYAPTPKQPRSAI